MADKEKLHIKRFDGVIGIADAHDLPVGAAYYAENLDIVTRDGNFVGLPEDEAYANAHAGTQDTELFEDGDTGVTYDTTTGVVKVVTFSHSGLTVSAETMSPTQASAKTPAMASSGQAVHMGFGNTSADAPKWVGTVYHDQFNDGAAGDRIIADAELTSEAIGWCRYNGNQDITANIRLILPRATNANDGAVGSFGTYARFDNSTNNFQLGSKYVWYASAVYDGSQEAPPVKVMQMDISPSGVYVFNKDGVSRDLKGNSESAFYFDQIAIRYGTSYTLEEFASTSKWRLATGHSTTGRATAPITGIEEVHFVIKVRTADTSGLGLDVINRRVSGVKLYRSEILQDEAGNNVESEPLFIKHYFLDDDAVEPYTWVSVTSAGAASEHFDQDGTYRYLQVIDSYSGTYSFESSSGYAATVDHMEINWGLSCISNQYHIIGDCWHRDLQDVDTYLFRSKPFLYNTFDWTEEYLVLPSKPTAIVSYDGKVYAFSSGKIYVIDPVVFDIESTWEGMGVSSRKSVTVTESGMYWASNTGIHHFFANRVDNIGLPVLRLTRPQASSSSAGDIEDVGWINRNTSVTPVCVYSPIHESLIVFYAFGTGAVIEYPAFMYHARTGRMVPISDLGSQVVGAHVSSGGSVVYSNSSGVYTRMFTGTNRRPWRFVSRQLGEQGEVYKYYTIYLGTDISDDKPLVYFYMNDPSYKRRLPAKFIRRRHENLYEFEFLEPGATEWHEARDLAIEIVDPVGNRDCTDITLIRRPTGPR
jgi:hypothetical protein